MKILKKIKVYSYTKEVVDKTLCDICGEPVRPYSTENPYEFNETLITHKHGERYPDSGYGKEIEVDICHICFQNTFLPWIRKFNQTKAEYTKWSEG